MEKRIKTLEKRKSNSEKSHQKKRLLFNLSRKLDRVLLEQESGKMSLCFGSKHLFRAQFDLEANGYESHSEWLENWKESRENSFFLLGSKDETGGNQSCTATLTEDNKITLRIRLPNYLTKELGKYLILSSIHFPYGHQNIVSALQSCEERKQLLTLKDPEAHSKGLTKGFALSYRFKRDRKGWRLFVSVPVSKSSLTTSSQTRCYRDRH